MLTAHEYSMHPFAISNMTDKNNYNISFRWIISNFGCFSFMIVQSNICFCHSLALKCELESESAKENMYGVDSSLDTDSSHSFHHFQLSCHCTSHGLLWNCSHFGSYIQPHGAMLQFAVSTGFPKLNLSTKRKKTRNIPLQNVFRFRLSSSISHFSKLVQTHTQFI